MKFIKKYVENRRKQKIKKISNKIYELMKTGYYGTNMFHELEFRYKKTT